MLSGRSAVESGGRWQYCWVLAKGLFRVGIGVRLVVLVIALGLSVVMFTLVEPPGSLSEPGAAVFACLALLCAGRPAAVVVHECGHLLACLALGVRVREFRIGRPDRGAYRFAVRGVTVAVGKPFAGQVVHDPVASRWRAVVIVIAGSLANLVAAGVLLGLGLATAPPLSGAGQVPVHQAIEVSLAALFAATGISGLLPLRTEWGSLSDGARLLTLGSERLARALGQDETVRGPKGRIWRPANAEEAAEYQLDSAVLKQLADDPGAKVPPELVDKWLAAYRDRTFIGLVTARAVARTLRRDGRVGELLHLLEEYPAPRGKLAPAMWRSLPGLAYEVALLPGLPPHVVNMSVDRLQQVIDAYDSAAVPSDHVARAAVLHSMAVARLRQGNFGVVEQLCQQGLASREVSPRDRATVLATVALARRALGQPYETLLAEAVGLAPEADLVAEASGRSAANEDDRSSPARISHP